MFNRSFLIFSLALYGCGIDRADFMNEYGEAYCDWKQECGKIDYYGSRSECINEAEAEAFRYAPNAEGCSFDEDKAQTCLDGFEDLDCMETPSQDIPSCQQISDCFGNQDANEPQTVEQ
jgi:hypothetical protein